MFEIVKHSVLHVFSDFFEEITSKLVNKRSSVLTQLLMKHFWPICDFRHRIFILVST